MTDYDYVIAVDPGADGCVALLDQHGNCKTWLFASQRKQLISELPKFLTSAFVIVEDVHAIYGTASKSTFAFGRNLGKIEGIIEALGGTVHARVVSYDWQAAVTKKVLRPFTRGMADKAKKKILHQHKVNLKNESIRAAESAYPGVVLNHDGVADAINIGRYGVLVLQGKINMATPAKTAVKKKTPADKKPAPSTKKSPSKKGTKK